jgi:hypothetical protein
VATATNDWKNRLDLTVVLVPPAELMPNPLNPRRHPEAQRSSLRAALDELGWIAPVTVNTTTGNLVDGHARVEEALDAGAPAIPVIYVTLTEEQERLALATLDPIGALAFYDPGAWAALSAELSLDGLADSLKTLVGDLTELWPLEPIEGGDGTGLAGEAEGLRGELLDLFDVTLAEPVTEVAAGDVWTIGLSVLVVADVMNGWELWAPHLTPGSKFVPYPGPAVLMSGRLVSSRLVMVQPVHYIAAGMIDRALTMFPGKVAKQ